MAKSFLLEIVTPEKLFYNGKAELLIARTLSGDEGFMAGHSWGCKLLGTGELLFRETGSNDFRIAAISGGFIDIRDYILVFTDSAEWPEEIDVERANAAIAREQEWLSRHDSPEESKEEIEEHIQAAKRAENRQKVAAGGRRQRH